MTEFSIEHGTLVDIVSKCQNRTFAEEVEALGETGNDVDWLVRGVCSDGKIGISTSEENI